MLKKLSKFMGLFLSCILMVTAVGCSNSGQETNGSSVNGKVKIEFYHGLGGNLGDNLQKLITEFNANNEKYEIVPVVQGNYTETLQALQAALASKTPPALAINGYPEFMKLAESDVLAPLENYVNQPEYNKEDLLAPILAQGNYKGRLLAVPAYASTQVMYYRKDLFEKNNIDYDSLKNFEELAQAAKTIKEKEGAYGWSIMWYTEHMIDYARSAGGDVLSEDGKTVTIDSEEWITAWDTIRKLIHEDKVMETVYGGNGWEWWYKTIDNVMNGKSAGYTGSSGDGGDLDFSIISTGMQKGFGDAPARPVAVSVVFNIFKDVPVEQQEGAWEFIKYFTSPENTAEWAIQTGYIPVRKSAVETEKFQKKLEENPSAGIPLQQAETIGIPPFIDPTGGKIYGIIDLAKDGVLIENKPAAEVLKKAQIEAQKELDKVTK